MKEIKDTIIHIRDTICWRCGKKLENENSTNHHGIPQALKPIKNVTVPICETCHEELNTVDYSTLLPFCYRIKCDADALLNKVELLLPVLENLSATQQKLDEAINKKKKK